MKDLACTFYIVRHGQTDWNKKKLLTGTTDIPLNKTGEIQAGETGKLLKKIHFDLAFSSDLLRAKQTAEIIVKERELAVVTSNLIRERNFGQLEGKSSKNLENLIESYRELSDEEINKHKVDESYESNDEMISRVITFLREIAVANSGKTVLIVSHGSLLRTLLIHLGYFTHKDAPYRIIYSAGFVKLMSDGVEFKILEINQGNKY